MCANLCSRKQHRVIHDFIGCHTHHHLQGAGKAMHTALPPAQRKHIAQHTVIQTRTRRALSANLRVDTVSSAKLARRDTVAMMVVCVLPPKESCNNRCRGGTHTSGQTKTQVHAGGHGVKGDIAHSTAPRPRHTHTHCRSSSRYRRAPQPHAHAPSAGSHGRGCASASPPSARRYSCPERRGTC